MTVLPSILSCNLAGNLIVVLHYYASDASRILHRSIDALRLLSRTTSIVFAAMASFAISQHEYFPFLSLCIFLLFTDCQLSCLH